MGTYFVSESGLPSGWALEASPISCKTGDSPFDYNPQSGFTIANGDSVVCTITNTRTTGQVTVGKDWVGGARGETPP